MVSLICGGFISQFISPRFKKCIAVRRVRDCVQRIPRLSLHQTMTAANLQHVCAKLFELFMKTWIEASGANYLYSIKLLLCVKNEDTNNSKTCMQNYPCRPTFFGCIKNWINFWFIPLKFHLILNLSIVIAVPRVSTLKCCCQAFYRMQICMHLLSMRTPPARSPSERTLLE